MRGVSEVIAIILILMITIAIAGLAYTFMSSTIASTTSAASSAVTTTTSSMLTSFTIESIDAAKVYIRNTGQNALTDLSVYVNDVPAHFSLTPIHVVSGQIGTITIYDFLMENDNIKIMTLNGFSASKEMTDPCKTAFGCWKLDEGIGTIAYDSSLRSNHGTLTNGPTWTTGRYGRALQFDGLDDYVSTVSADFVNKNFTVSAWIRTTTTTTGSIVCQRTTNIGFEMLTGTAVSFKGTYNPGGKSAISTVSIADGSWHHIAGVLIANDTNYQNSTAFIYIDGVQNTNSTVNSVLSSVDLIDIGRRTAGNHFNGTLDEIRIYDRAIY